MYWGIPTAIPLIALVCYGVLLVITARQGLERAVNRFFALYLLSMLVWSLGAFMMYVDALNALFWNRVMLSGFVGVPVAFFAFVRAFLRVERRPWLLYPGGVALVTLLVLNAWGYLTEYVYITEEGLIRYQFGPAVPLFMIYSAFFIGFAALSLIRGYRRTTDSIERNRIRYALLGVSAIALGSATNIFPALGAYPIDIAANVINALLIAYAIFRYQLLDITVVVRKGLLYSIPTAIIGAGYFLVVFLAVNLFHIVTGYQVLLLSLAMAAVTAVAFQPLRERAQAWVDRLFFREKYDAYLMLQKLSREVTSVIHLEELLNMVLNELAAKMHVARVGIFLKEAKAGDFPLAAQRGLDEDLAHLRLRKDHPVVSWLMREVDVLTRQEIGMLPHFRALWSEEREQLERLGDELFIPLKAKDQLVGILAVGPKLSEVAYSQDDQLTLTTLANQTAVAIENARLYDEAQQEITERKRAEEELKEGLEQVERAKREWESTADSLPQFVCLLDHRGCIIRANQAVERWNLGRVGDVKGRGVHELFHPGCTDPACYLGTFWLRAWEELAQGRPAECEAEDRVLQRHVNVLIQPILPRIDQAGKKPISFAVVSVDDITERKRTEEAIERRNTELSAVLETSQALASVLELDDLLELIMHSALETIESAESGVIHLLDGATGELYPSALMGKPSRVMGKQRMRLGEGIAGCALELGRLINVPDVNADPRFITLGGSRQFRSLLVAPLVANGKKIGTISINSGQIGAFTQEDARLLMTLAAHAATAVKNAQLFAQSEELAIAKERNRMACEIHDGLGQSLASLLMKIDYCHGLIDGDPQATKATLAEVKALVRENIREVRRSIFALYPTDLEKQGFLPALREYAQGFEKQSALPVHLSIVGEEVQSRLPPTHEYTLFRIVQEALGNVRRHAAAENVWIVLDRSDPNVITLTVMDDGVGFDIKQQEMASSTWLGGFGLMSMRERAEALGGRLSVETEPGSGTKISAILPLRKGE